MPCGYSSYWGKEITLEESPMQDTDLFQLALGLFPPWLVESCRLDVKGKRLDIYIDFSRGGEFPCPECGRMNCKAYDTVNKVWRHLNFFEHRAYLHVRTPRVAVCGMRGETGTSAMG